MYEEVEQLLSLLWCMYRTEHTKENGKKEEIIWPWNYSAKECKFHSEDGNATGSRDDTRT